MTEKGPLLLFAHVTTAVLLTGRVVSGFHPAVARRAQVRVARVRADFAHAAPF
ncbi:hypothetical protein [Mycobacterium bourgelatii]|uniref:hypothetical protein n=1 Tax=Mycobacterium bourgelatii TaxID=1273442 RepID=UPI0013D4EA52|nr:hypothetical protein [Mycobacterium bourgelatii]MCV6973611.1 hypothetical protein [Mycobacterium bourgelatii]